MVFNHIPGKWLTDYDEEPSEELLHPTQQRIKSTPWKYVFAFFICCEAFIWGSKIPATCVSGVGGVVAATEMSIADQAYRLCRISSFAAGRDKPGFVTRHPGGPLDAVWGALLGFGVLAAMALLAKLLYKPAIGGADVKLFGVGR